MLALGRRASVEREVGLNVLRHIYRGVEWDEEKNELQFRSRSREIMWIGERAIASK